MYSDEIESIFDHRTNSYVFNDYNTMHFGNYITAGYNIQEDKSIIFDFISIEKGAPKEAVNSIIFELEKLIIKQDITNDNIEMITEEKLDLFSLAQILLFINLSKDSNSTKVSTVLLEYKNKKYQEYNYLDELVLTNE